jgi:D-arabinose 1-dehydrogenase-like Zn-dependent alcohol dehydrogenase
VIDYTTEDVVDTVRSRYPEGIDALADMHGDREGMARLADLVQSGGHVASAVGAADVDALAGRGIEATNVIGTVTTTALDTLAGLVTAGDIVVPELHTFTLDDAGDALAAVGTGHVRGKVVVTVD